jgi:hypothetical protein
VCDVEMLQVAPSALVGFKSQESSYHEVRLDVFCTNVKHMMPEAIFDGYKTRSACSGHRGGCYLPKQTNTVAAVLQSWQLMLV